MKRGHNKKQQREFEGNPEEDVNQQNQDTSAEFENTDQQENEGDEDQDFEARDEETEGAEEQGYDEGDEQDEDGEEQEGDEEEEGDEYEEGEEEEEGDEEEAYSGVDEMVEKGKKYFHKNFGKMEEGNFIKYASLAVLTAYTLRRGGLLGTILVPIAVGVLTKHLLENRPEVKAA
ncbi:MAG: hypothetical protein U0V74_15025 [Chitinophagales bacterium]